MSYVELQVATNFSFLRGASHAEELVATAAQLGHDTIAITDRNSVAGVVRAFSAGKHANVRIIVGARLDLVDGPSVLCLPSDRAAYGRLTTLLTVGRKHAAKGECILRTADLFAHGAGQNIVVLPPETLDSGFAAALRRFRDALNPVYLGAHQLYGGDDATRLDALGALADRLGVGLVATNDVHYHVPERRALQDVLTCVREQTTLAGIGRRVFANGERYLKSHKDMARLFQRRPDAIANTRRIAEACTFSLSELQYEYPVEAGAEGRTPQEELERQAWVGAARRYPDGAPDKVKDLLKHELTLIAELKYAPYFLTVHHIVSYARRKDILCQGRGSAANSAVCFCLGITEVDPDKTDLLFERFVSGARGEPPDIDVDFEHERREEVIQHIYDEYGRDHAGIAATVICYRPRSAIRDVGKVFGLSSDTIAVLNKLLWRDGAKTFRDACRNAGLDPDDPTIVQVLRFAHEIMGFPRHLSQHVGGFVITRGKLHEMVPIENAAMEDRTFIEWDKDDLDAVGMLKIDVLALGMLTSIRKCFDLIAQHHGKRWTMATLPKEDPKVYDMLCTADAVGVFQVESRAQMSMLPRLKPRTFYDLVVEVAIVRPGPIQGDMVHPYLRRRQGLEAITYPSKELREVLQKTYGVPLFQEQAMKIAIVAAGFTPDEADKLRRAMATFRRSGEIAAHREKFIAGMIKNDYPRDFAERCFKQIEGFSDYGFPESHAASFANLVYVSAWLKHYYPAAFTASLLNSQPMGFYAPAQLVRDATDHGVEARPIDVNFSDWDSTLEAAPGGRVALRLGLREITGFRERDAIALMKNRAGGYDTVDDLWRRSGLSSDALELLADADAFSSLAMGRRDALWRVKALGVPLPLFAHAAAQERRGANEPPIEITQEPFVALPQMTLGQNIMADYRTMELSLRKHPLALLRPQMDRDGCVPHAKLGEIADGARVTVGGLVLIRQQPGTASGVIFVTLEDETGIANLVIWPSVFDRYRRTLLDSKLLVASGKLQKEGLVIHVVVDHLIDRSDAYAALNEGPDDRLIADPVAQRRNLHDALAAIPEGRNFH